MSRKVKMFRCVQQQTIQIKSLVGGRHSLLNRLYSTASQMHVEYAEYGDPRQVLHLKSERVSSRDDLLHQLHIRFLASPINPADINTIQGVYPIKPKLPAVGGNEGVAEVIEVLDCDNFKKGDWVVPNRPGIGTWSTDVFCLEDDVYRIPNDLPLVNAATLSVNPCSAFRMLHDFRNLAPGDVVIQNGANSGVGKAVIQIAHDMDIRTVNIVRDRDNLDETISELKSLGATYVFSDKNIDSEIKQLQADLPKAKLALNCVGGKSVIKLLKNLEQEGIVVTYGGMSKQPNVVPAGPFIFSDIRMQGFWMTHWNKVHKFSDEKNRMWEYLIDLTKKGKLLPPKHRLVPIQDFEGAIEKSMGNSAGEKQILVTCASYLSEYMEDDYD